MAGLFKYGPKKLELDGFVFPPTCARCAKEKPTQTWPVIGSIVVIPDDDNAPYYIRQRVDHIARVPVCEKCHTKLKGIGRQCWYLGLAGAVLATCFALSFAVASGEPLSNLLGAAFLFAAIGTIVLRWIFKELAFDGFGFATLNPRKLKLKFWNKEYQKLFDEKNPGLWRPGAGAPKASAASHGW